MVADDAQHVGAIALRNPGNAPSSAGHLGAGGVAFAGEDGGQAAQIAPALVAVVGDAGLHEHGAEVGVAEAERAEVVASSGDLLGGEAGHQHGDFQHDRPEPDAVLESLDVESPGFGVEEGEDVEGAKIAGGVVEEHVF